MNGLAEDIAAEISFKLSDVEVPLILDIAKRTLISYHERSGGTPTHQEADNDYKAIVKEFLKDYDPDSRVIWNDEQPWKWYPFGNEEDALNAGEDSGYHRAQYRLTKLIKQAEGDK